MSKGLVRLGFSELIGKEIKEYEVASSVLWWWMPNAVHGVPGSIERTEVDFRLFSSMVIRRQCIMRECWDTTPSSDSYIATFQIC